MSAALETLGQPACVYEGKRKDIQSSGDINSSRWSRVLDSVQTTCEKASHFHDETPWLNIEDNLEGQGYNKVVLELTGLPSKKTLIRKNLHWTNAKVSTAVFRRAIHYY